jgi:hypothetical protein
MCLSLGAARCPCSLNEPIVKGGNVDNSIRQDGLNARPIRKSLRLTFRVAGGEVQLVSYERLDMICPPSVVERPEMGKHGGFWLELRDANDQVLFHRILDNPLGASVEVHSPDGKIERIFGDVKENVFEVLLPDDHNAQTVALIGESLDSAALRKRKRRESRELARFDLPQGGKGMIPEVRGGGQ